MIHTAKQLKDKVKNISDGNSDVAQTLIRNFIMEEFEYPGIRVMMEANLERMRQPFKIDISTDDAITPEAVEYEYKLMFEERTIILLTYNLETLLAEKIQTILARGIANTRMRDFYDVYEIMTKRNDKVNMKTLIEAFNATCKKRKTLFEKTEIEGVLEKIETDAGLARLWDRYKDAYFYVGEIRWNDVIKTVIECIRKIIN